MKNSLFIILSFFINIYCSQGQNEKTLYQNEKNPSLNLVLNGKIKSASHSIHNLETETNDSIFYMFNKNGLVEEIIKVNTYNVNSVYKNNKTHFVFENGRLISEITSDVLGINSYYNYDTNGNNVSVKYYFNKNLASEDSLEYDNKNRLTKYSKYAYAYYNRRDIFFSYKSEYLDFLETYQYDSLNNMIEKTMDNIRGKIYHKWIYFYDDNNNLIEEGKCDNYEGINSKTDCIYSPLEGFTYSKEGLKTSSIQHGQWFPHSTSTYYKYNEKRNLEEIKGFYINKDTVLGYHQVYQYDDYGNKIKEEDVVGDYFRLDYFDKYKYSILYYDDCQNIIQQDYFSSNNKLIQMVKYTYIYDSFNNYIRREKYVGKNKNNLSKILINEYILEYE